MMSGQVTAPIPVLTGVLHCELLLCDSDEVRPSWVLELLRSIAPHQGRILG